MKYFYVICPVGADPDFPAKKEILESVGSKYALIPFFPLQQRSRFSVAAAKSDLSQAEFVLADLSRERPSCYFELGLAQAMDVPVVLIAGSGTRIHQVGENARIANYSDLHQYRLLISDILSSKQAVMQAIHRSE